jgi:uncharacterized protein
MRAAALSLLVVLLLLAPVLPTGAARALELGEPVVLRAAAVAETDDGLVGTTAAITVTAARGGAGHIFLDTFPLAEVDMQGSARLAVRVAGQVTGMAWQEHDFFFVVRSGAPVIGGPSAGATLTVGAIAALAGWKVREDALMTGTINPDGSIGPVGGIPEKAMGARAVGARLFLFPAGQATQLIDGAHTDLAAWCAATLAIECVPVVDVVDAVNLLTDHAIERPPVPTNVTGEDFRAVLGPLSERLREDAAALIVEADSALGSLDASTAAPWRVRLDRARDLLANATQAATNGSHYTAASWSFQSSIEAHTIRDSARLLASDEQGARLASLVEEARGVVADALRDVAASRVAHASAFETVGSAQVRVLEAERRVARASELAGAAQDLPTALAAVYEASYAVERARTATWWLGLTAHVPEGPPVDGARLEDAAREAIALAEEGVAYIDAVLRESAGPGATSGAASRIAEAKAALERGFASGAILLAYEAEVRAANVLEVGSYGGGVPEGKFETARVAAARAIAEARARGVEPLLAQSQYEFGLTLEDPFERLSFLGLARVTANLAGLPGALDAGGLTPAQTRFQGIPAFPGAPPGWVAAAFAAGLALGAGAGLTALMPKERREDEAEPALAQEG